MKVNKAGLNLRKKSTIHSSIIDNVTGRREVSVSDGILRNLKGISRGKKEFWIYNGEKVNKVNLKKIILKKFDPKSFDLKKNNILVLGPGKGSEIVFIKKLLKEINVDSLGLSRNLSPEAKELVRKDFSPENPSLKTSFENFNHLSLVRKYDLVYSSFGPVIHTQHPELVILKIASLLKPKGVAHILGGSVVPINYKLLDKHFKNNFSWNLDVSGSLIIERTK